MADLKIPVSALSIVAQPLIIVKKEIISYMNPAAIALAAKDCTGKPASALLPSHLIGTHSGGFTATAFVGTKSCIANVYSSPSEEILVLTPDSATESVEATVFASLRSSLANLRICGSRLSQLAEMRSDAKLRSYSVAVNRSYYRMKRNIDNLSLIDLMHRKAYPFAAESTDLTEFFGELIGSIRILMGSDAGVSIDFNAPEQLYTVVDRYLAELALLNLLSNSLAHCKAGDRISVSLLKTDKSTVLAVNDSGSGIDAEALPRIFCGSRSEDELSAAAQGVGLGLATVRCIAELHDGALIVESRGSGLGTSVRLMFSNYTSPSRTLKTKSSCYDLCGMQSILQELTSCLPDDCYGSLTDD